MSKEKRDRKILYIYIIISLVKICFPFNIYIPFFYDHNFGPKTIF